MSWLLFLDEPGEGQSSFPYGVLTGIAVEDLQVWPLTRKLRDAQDQFFGRQLTDAAGRYAAIPALLDAKVYEDAALHSRLDPGLAPCHGDRGAGERAFSNSEVSAALAQAKIAYCDHALSLARDFGASALAMFLPVEALRVRFDDRLRKDYAFLIERFHHFLDGRPGAGAGMLVLQRTSRYPSAVHPRSIVDYHTRTTNGRLRARRIVPEPVYADGALDVLFHLAELVSYVASWSIRLPHMTEPRRPEMGALSARCNDLRFSYVADNGKKDWSFKFIADLQPGSAEQGHRRRAPASAMSR